MLTDTNLASHNNREPILEQLRQYLPVRAQMYGKLCLINGAADAQRDFKRPLVAVPKECQPAGKVALSVPNDAAGDQIHSSYETKFAPAVAHELAIANHELKIEPRPARHLNPVPSL